jgi:hypothetical protein
MNNEHIKDKQNRFTKTSNQIKYQLSQFETVESHDKQLILHELKVLLSELEKHVSITLLSEKRN